MSVRQVAMSRALKRPNDDQTRIQEDQRGWKPGAGNRRRRKPAPRQGQNLNIPGNLGGNRRT